MRNTRRPLVWAALVLMFAALPSHALDGQVFLTWEDCDKDDAGYHDTVYTCQTNDGVNALYGAFILDQPVSDVVGIEASVDLQHSAGTLPDWWRLQNPGDCRDGEMRGNGNFTAIATCADPWLDLGEGLVTFSGRPNVLANQLHLVGIYAVRSDSARTLEAGTMYYGFEFMIGNQRTVFPGQCMGCAQPACLVLNSIKLLRNIGSVPPEYVLDSPGPGNANRAVWRGGSGADCTAVPVRASTWGRLKSLYR